MKLLRWILAGLSRPPTFDIWFWMLVIWSFVVPYLYETVFLTECMERNELTLVSIKHILDGQEQTFKCVRVMSDNEVNP
jgi:hypothetical protein